MSRLLLVLVVLGLAFAARYRLGTPISEELAAQYDPRPVVLPDGRGLPPGEGKVEEGRRIYAEKCASCHGANGEGYPFNRLVSEPFPITPDTEPVEYAIGNYWQYPTTLFDYIRRTMPFGQGGTLSNEEVYHLVAYLPLHERDHRRQHPGEPGDPTQGSDARPGPPPLGPRDEAPLPLAYPTLG